MVRNDEVLTTVALVSEQDGMANAKPGRVDVSKRKNRPQDLTPREGEILQLVWSGLTNRHIAQQLKISIKTAEAHRANMMKKLRVSNTAQLLKTALETGLLADATDAH
ncbi:MAG: LuxR C-terminal-related transcriptional regulator [Nitrospiraceae bacterium]|jgi:DNA-binding NarL/FixJ family response regulator